jgi:hypothetical protein
VCKVDSVEVIKNMEDVVTVFNLSSSEKMMSRYRYRYLTFYIFMPFLFFFMVTLHEFVKWANMLTTFWEDNYENTSFVLYVLSFVTMIPFLHSLKSRIGYVWISLLMTMNLFYVFEPDDKNKSIVDLIIYVLFIVAYLIIELLMFYQYKLYVLFTKDAIMMVATILEIVASI